MIKESVLFKETHIFSNLMLDYVSGKESLRTFYNDVPNRDSFIKQAEIKSDSYKNRETLYESLLNQYKGFKLHQSVSDNLKVLKENNAFTITTGHQLNLFTGPLYFIYKIIGVINLSEEMNRISPDKKFIPVYWMATEDHDFDEINHFHYEDKVIRWNSNQKGAVGHFNLKGIETVLETIEILLPTSKKKNYLINLFKQAYSETSNLACATRILVNELFEIYGLIIVDGDDKNLKKLFKPFVEEELLHNTSFKKVTDSAQQLKDLGYKIQVNPREINLFYLFKGGRERIVFENNMFLINNTNLKFSKEEILKELELNPQNFSPNVLLRPLYQEIVLPNVAYVGGGGEIAYWLELKTFFESQKIPFPLIKLRNSVLVIDQSIRKKIDKKNLHIEDVFKNTEDLFNGIVRRNTDIELSFENYFKTFDKEFLKLKTLAKATDHSFLNAVNAHEVKVLKSIKTLEKRLFKAEKLKFFNEKNYLTSIYNSVHPNGKVQERFLNYSEMIVKTDISFIKQVQNELNPFEDEFVILTF